MTRLNVIVEGQTEETFIRDELSNHLGRQGVYVVARRVETSRKRRRVHRGGMTNYLRARRDIQRWLKQDGSACLTTMFDLYGLPEDFPGVDQAKNAKDAYHRVETIETAFANDIGDRRFIPYIQLHEFEALLFSRVEIIDEILMAYEPSRLDELRSILLACKSPEEIDDGDTTAPSKRLLALYPRYDKPTFGIRICERIGVETIRQECPHFNDWVSKLEALVGIAPGARSPEEADI